MFKAMAAVLVRAAGHDDEESGESVRKVNGESRTAESRLPPPWMPATTQTTQTRTLRTPKTPTRNRRRRGRSRTTEELDDVDEDDLDDVDETST